MLYTPVSSGALSWDFVSYTTSTLLVELSEFESTSTEFSCRLGAVRESEGSKSSGESSGESSGGKVNCTGNAGDDTTEEQAEELREDQAEELVDAALAGPRYAELGVRN
jgi:hypothetical protein